jgi:hypothetical protein
MITEVVHEKLMMMLAMDEMGTWNNLLEVAE